MVRFLASINFKRYYYPWCFCSVVKGRYIIVFKFMCPSVNISIVFSAAGAEKIHVAVADGPAHKTQAEAFHHKPTVDTKGQGGNP